MVNDFRTFTAWSLGLISALLAGALIDSGTSRGWLLGLGLFVVIMIASFWRICGSITVEGLQFLQGAIEARRIRKGIDTLPGQSGLIIRAGGEFEAGTWERQVSSARKV
jgi:hypothetical protein